MKTILIVLLALATAVSAKPFCATKLQSNYGVCWLINKPMKDLIIQDVPGEHVLSVLKKCKANVIADYETTKELEELIRKLEKQK